MQKEIQEKKTIFENLNVMQYLEYLEQERKKGKKKLVKDTSKMILPKLKKLWKNVNR